jgi:hypothetical protein
MTHVFSRCAEKGEPSSSPKNLSTMHQIYLSNFVCVTIGIPVPNHFAIGIPVPNHFTIGILVPNHFTTGIPVPNHFAIGIPVPNHFANQHTIITLFEALHINF